MKEILVENKLMRDESSAQLTHWHHTNHGVSHSSRMVMVSSLRGTKGGTDDLSPRDERRDGWFVPTDESWDGWFVPRDESWDGWLVPRDERLDGSFVPRDESWDGSFVPRDESWDRR